MLTVKRYRNQPPNMSSDTWSDIEKLRRNQESLRERIKRRRQGHKGESKILQSCCEIYHFYTLSYFADLLAQTGDSSESRTQDSDTNENLSKSTNNLAADPETSGAKSAADKDTTAKIDPDTEKKFQRYLCHHSLEFPMSSVALTKGFMKVSCWFISILLSAVIL